MAKYNLSKKIFTANNKSKTFIELYNLKIILKEFIKELKDKLGVKAIGSKYAEEEIDELVGEDLI